MTTATAARPFTRTTGQDATERRKRTEKRCLACDRAFMALAFGRYCCRRCRNHGPARARPALTLSRRQRDALISAARGETQREGAARLYVAPSVLAYAMAGAKAKLGAQTITHAVALALVRGVLRADEIEGG